MMSKKLHKFTRVSGFTGKTHTREIELDMDDYYRWESGRELVQNALPYLSAEDREFLMTGITPEEWNEVFNNDCED
jgi:hypothetical protein